MNINERIKLFRKNNGWSQKQFASLLGVTQSGVSYMEQNGSTVSDSSIKTICLAFNLNESWLRDGIEPMYTQPPSFSLDQLIKEHGAGEIEKRILTEWFGLDPEIRSEVLECFKKAFADDIKEPAAGLTYQELQNIYDNLPKTPEEFEKLYPPVPVEEIDGKKDAG